MAERTTRCSMADGGEAFTYYATSSSNLGRGTEWDGPFDSERMTWASRITGTCR
ncbi:MAG: hypothetical protein ABEL76_09205 [Bradymonadaceae bacterium]